MLKQDRWKTVQYLVMWKRVCASLVDMGLQLMVTTPILYAVYGKDYFSKKEVVAGTADIVISWVLPIAACVLMLIYKQATPGKMLFDAIVVDADTGEPPSPRQVITRSAGYMLSIIPFGLGFVWAFFDSRNQGWHDKLANTVVVTQGK